MCVGPHVERVRDAALVLVQEVEVGDPFRRQLAHFLQDGWEDAPVRVQDDIVRAQVDVTDVPRAVAADVEVDPLHAGDRQRVGGLANRATLHPRGLDLDLVTASDEHPLQKRHHHRRSAGISEAHAQNPSHQVKFQGPLSS